GVTGYSEVSVSSIRTTDSEMLWSQANCAWSMTSWKSSPVVTWPFSRSYSRRSMLRRVLWRRRRARRRVSSFSRAGESLFVGNKLELGESIFECHLYSPIVGRQFQNECSKKKASTQNSHRVLGTQIKCRSSVVVALLPDGKRDGKPVARWRERAGRVRSVGARRVFQAIEIEHEFA